MFEHEHECASVCENMGVSMSVSVGMGVIVSMNVHQRGRAWL